MNDVKNTPPSLIVVGGPTGIGKTYVGIELAKALNGEVISADSVQIFEGFVIGAATPSLEERQGIPHHLLSALSPRQDISAAEFATLADNAIADVLARGKTPIVVGGSGLYMRALLYGLIEAPPRDDALRAELEALADAKGNAHLWEKLERVDPQSAQELHPNDRVRVIRALEVKTLTGTSIRETQQAHRFQKARYRVAGVGLTARRPYIHDRINRRSAQMFDDGLIDEVRALLDAGVPRNAQPFTAIGYREILDYLDALERMQSSAPAQEENLETTSDTSENTPNNTDENHEATLRRTAQKDVATHTRRFARRQLVWFRKEPSFRWFNAETLDLVLPEIVEGCAAFLRGGTWAAGLENERDVSEPANNSTAKPTL